MQNYDQHYQGGGGGQAASSGGGSGSGAAAAAATGYNYQNQSSTHYDQGRGGYSQQQTTTSGYGSYQQQPAQTSQGYQQQPTTTSGYSATGGGGYTAAAGATAASNEPQYQTRGGAGYQQQGSYAHQNDYGGATATAGYGQAAAAQLAPVTDPLELQAKTTNCRHAQYDQRWYEACKERFRHRIAGEYFYAGLVWPAQGGFRHDYVRTISDMKLRPDDVIVATYPKSGTTWVQEIVWLLQNDCQFQQAQALPAHERVPFLEEHECGKPYLDKLANSARVIKTHMPYCLLPQSAKQQNNKIIYCYRNPKDVAHSYFHFYRANPDFAHYREDWDTFYEMFNTGYVTWGNWFDHVTEYASVASMSGLTMLGSIHNPQDAAKAVTHGLSSLMSAGKGGAGAVAAGGTGLTDAKKKLGSIGSESMKKVGWLSGKFGLGGMVPPTADEEQLEQDVQQQNNTAQQQAAPLGAQGVAGGKLKNVLVVSFEDMKVNPEMIVRRIAAFLGKNPALDQIDGIIKNTTFDKIKDTPNMYPNVLDHRISHFMRKGEVGDWKNRFTVNQSMQFDELVKKRLANTYLPLQYH